MTIGGAICIRNGNDLDFCWKEAVQSLLPICDEVCICDAESTDGTQEEIREWLKREPKLNLCVYPWPDPKGDLDFWVKWLNYARQHLKTDWHLQLDADEVLHEDSYPLVKAFADTRRRSALVTRYNFWRDHRNLIPEGHCCGKRVIRMAPQNVWMASDGFHPMGHECSSMVQPTQIEIFHYGFIRRPAAFFKKERGLQGFFFDSYDPRLEDAEKEVAADPSKNWMQVDGVSGWINQLDQFSGSHPKVAHQWLKDRNYDPT